MSTLDLTPIRSALQQLEDGLAAAEREPGSEIIRDGVIQRFEYSHELALCFIKRVLETQHGDPVDRMQYNELLRTAAERGYIENVEQWFEYHSAQPDLACLRRAGGSPRLRVGKAIPRKRPHSPCAT